jgi:hypothetical protein
MLAVTNFERFILAQPVRSLRLSSLGNAWAASDADLAERADILLYGGAIPRGEENLRRVAIAVGILPGSADEIRDLEVAGY